MSGTRKRIRELSVHQRAGGLNAGDVLRAERLLLVSSVLLLLEDEDDIVPVALLALWVELTKERHIARPHYAPIRRSIDGVTESEAHTKFRFRKDQLPSLLQALRLPSHFVGDNGCRYSREEALLFMLRRHSTPLRLHDLEQEFGRDHTSLSRLFKLVTDFVYDTHADLVKKGLERFVDSFDLFAEKIHHKGVQLIGDGDLNQAETNVAGFIDGTGLEICRITGRGDLQGVTYTGHKRKHVLSFQGACCPNGLIVDFTDPYPGRHHDEFMVTDSNINGRMRDAQFGRERQYKLVGDKGYTVRSHIGQPFVGAVLSPEQRAFNLILSKLRVSVEHLFGKVKVMSAFLMYDYQLKVFKSPVGKYMVNAVLLANAHTCLNGSVVGSYFDVEAPGLAEYFSG